METSAVAVIAPTRADPAGIYTYHNTTDGISVAVELVDGGNVNVALAVCSFRDNFSKKKAQMILRARLAKKRFISSDEGRACLTFPIGSYKGTRFKDDVFQPILEYIRENAYLYVGAFSNSRCNRRRLLSSLIFEIIKIRDCEEAHLS